MAVALGEGASLPEPKARTQESSARRDRATRRVKKIAPHEAPAIVDSQDGDHRARGRAGGAPDLLRRLRDLGRAASSAHVAVVRGQRDAHGAAAAQRARAPVAPVARDGEAGDVRGQLAVRAAGLERRSGCPRARRRLDVAVRGARAHRRRRAGPRARRRTRARCARTSERPRGSRRCTTSSPGCAHAPPFVQRRRRCTPPCSTVTSTGPADALQRDVVVEASGEDRARHVRRADAAVLRREAGLAADLRPSRRRSWSRRSARPPTSLRLARARAARGPRGRPRTASAVTSPCARLHGRARPRAPRDVAVLRRRGAAGRPRPPPARRRGGWSASARPGRRGPRDVAVPGLDLGGAGDALDADVVVRAGDVGRGHVGDVHARRARCARSTARVRGHGQVEVGLEPERGRRCRSSSSRLVTTRSGGPPARRRRGCDRRRRAPCSSVSRIHDLAQRDAHLGRAAPRRRARRRTRSPPRRACPRARPALLRRRR